MAQEESRRTHPSATGFTKMHPLPWAREDQSLANRATASELGQARLLPAAVDVRRAGTCAMGLEAANIAATKGYDCELRKVQFARYSEFLGYALWFYDGEAFDALQIVWPDKACRYPWDDGYGAPINQQPATW
jgi:hypothetical protein